MIYPGHGIVKYNKTVERLIEGRTKQYHVYTVVDNGMTIMVQHDAIHALMRPLISKDEVTEVLKVLNDTTTKIDQTRWNRRYREYMEKIKTGSIYEVAEVVRNLQILKASKDLSFGERKMLDQANYLVQTEIDMVLKGD